jgi:C4-type zinc ribbon domain
MTTDKTLRALVDLSQIDRQLSGEGALKDRVAHALEGRRAGLRKAIPGNFLAAYDALGRAGRRPAVVPVVRGAHCGGCYMRIPPQLESLVRRGQSLCSCPHCRRLLYSSTRAADFEVRSEPEHKPAGVGATNQRKSNSRRTLRAKAGGRPPVKKPQPLRHSALR